MQKSLKVIMATAVICFLLSGNTLAQDAHASADTKTMFSNIPAVEKTISTSSNEDILAKNPAIVATFSTMFPLATSSKWANVNDDLWVSFLDNGRKTSACFSAKGKINYAISDCAMGQLPAKFSKTIKKDYALYSMVKAIEIKAHDAVAYEVVLENQLNFIRLKYTSQGVEEVQKINKTTR